MHYDVIFKFYSWLILEIIICWRVSRCKYCDTVSYFAYSRLPNKQHCTLIIFFTFSPVVIRSKSVDHITLVTFTGSWFSQSPFCEPFHQRTWTETVHGYCYVENPVKSFDKLVNKRDFLKFMNVGFFLSFYISL